MAKLLQPSDVAHILQQLQGSASPLDPVQKQAIFEDLGKVLAKYTGTHVSEQADPDPADETLFLAFSRTQTHPAQVLFEPFDANADF